MIKKIFLLLLFSLMLFAHSCENRLFNLKAMTQNGSSVTIKDILQELSLECDLTILFEDKESKKVINKPLDFVNIKNYTLTELLDFLLAENNLFYSYNRAKSLIKIAYYRTKSFNIDYINVSSMESESRKSIVFGASGESGGTTSGYGGGTTTAGTSGTTTGGGAESNAYTTITTKSVFTFWKSLKEQLGSLLMGVSGERDFKIFINKDASLVTVTGTKRELEEVEKFLQKLSNRMHKQVMIEAKLIEVRYNDAQTKGIDWSKFNLSATGGSDAVAVRKDGFTINGFRTPNYFVGYNFSMQGLFDFLKKYGDVKILSNPKILTLNNQPAIINVGNQLSYRYETSGTTNIQGGSTVGTVTYSIGQSFIGITLYVIPEITDSNDIIMKINPVTSELIQNNQAKDPNTNMRVLPPDIKIKQLTSIVKVKDGQKILIGGLISKNYSNEHNKVPVVGDIPIVGTLFHSKRKTTQKSELFILIVPKIIKEHSFPTIDDVALMKDVP